MKKLILILILSVNLCYANNSDLFKLTKDESETIDKLALLTEANVLPDPTFKPPLISKVAIIVIPTIIVISIAGACCFLYSGVSSGLDHASR